MELGRTSQDSSAGPGGLYGRRGYPGQPGADMTQVGLRPRNGLGVAALVIGVIAILTSWTVIGGCVLGLGAIVLGVVGRGRARRGEATNPGVATAGIVAGAVGLLLSAALIALGVSALNSSSGKAYTKCLKQAQGNTAAVQQCARQFQRSISHWPLPSYRFSRRGQGGRTRGHQGRVDPGRRSGGTMAEVHVPSLDSDGPLDPARHLMRVRAMQQRQVDMTGLPLPEADGGAVPSPLTFGVSEGRSPTPTMRSVWHGEQEEGPFLWVATSAPRWAQQAGNLTGIARRVGLLEIARDITPPTDVGPVQIDLDGSPVTFTVGHYTRGWLARGDWQDLAVTIAARYVPLAGLTLRTADPTRLNLPGPFRLDPGPVAGHQVTC